MSSSSIPATLASAKSMPPTAVSGNPTPDHSAFQAILDQNDLSHVDMIATAADPFASTGSKKRLVQNQSSPTIIREGIGRVDISGELKPETETDLNSRSTERERSTECCNSKPKHNRIDISQPIQAQPAKATAYPCIPIPPHIILQEPSSPIQNRVLQTAGDLGVRATASTSSLSTMQPGEFFSTPVVQSSSDPADNDAALSTGIFQTIELNLPAEASVPQALEQTSAIRSHGVLPPSIEAAKGVGHQISYTPEISADEPAAQLNDAADNGVAIDNQIESSRISAQFTIQNDAADGMRALHSAKSHPADAPAEAAQSRTNPENRESIQTGGNQRDLGSAEDNKGRRGSELQAAPTSRVSTQVTHELSHIPGFTANQGSSFSPPGSSTHAEQTKESSSTFDNSHTLDSAHLRIAGDSGQIKLSVQVPELGKLEVRAVTSHDVTTAHVTASRHDAFQLLADGRAALEDSLRSHDIVLGSLDSRAGQYRHDHSQGHGNPPQQQHYAASSQNASSTSAFVTSANETCDPASEQRATFVEHSRFSVRV